MAKETTIKTCEEYVLNVLAEKEKELIEIKEERDYLANEFKVLQDQYFALRSLVCKALEGSKVEYGNYNTTVYVDNVFVGLFSEYGLENKDENDLRISALAKLIEMVNSTPKREE